MTSRTTTRTAETGRTNESDSMTERKPDKNRRRRKTILMPRTNGPDGVPQALMEVSAENVSKDDLMHAFKMMGPDSRDVVNFMQEVDMDDDGQMDVFVSLLEQSSFNPDTLSSEQLHLELEMEDDMMAVDLTLEDKMVFQRILRDLDMKDGILTPDAIQGAIDRLTSDSAEVSTEQLAFYFSLMQAAEASSHGGGIDIKTFVSIAKEHESFLEEYKIRMQQVRKTTGLTVERMASLILSLDVEKVGAYRQVFQALDKEGSGLIDGLALQEALTGLGRPPEDKETAFIFTLMQHVGEGLTSDEYIHLMENATDDIREVGSSVDIWCSADGQTSRTGRGSASQRNKTKVDSARKESEITVLPADYYGLREAISDVQAAAYNVMLEKINKALNKFVTSLGKTVQHGYLLQLSELLVFRNIYERLDPDDDSRISLDGLRSRLPALLGQKPTKKHLTEFLQTANPRNKGFISFEEFSIVIQKTRIEMMMEKEATTTPVAIAAPQSRPLVY